MSLKNNPCEETIIGCINAATIILGDKWTPHLIRVISNEERIRFCQLQAAVGGINPRTLSARLRDLEQQRIIKKSETSLLSRSEYCLTNKGKDLIPIIESMHAWSNKYSMQEAET